MHRAAYAQLGRDLVYLAADVPSDKLGTALDGLHALQAVGVNLTIPHKQAVIEMCEKLTPRAEALEAVNCLKPTPTGWEGHNTDADGWLDSWTEEMGLPIPRHVVILGRGGASRALQNLLSEHEVRVLYRQRSLELRPDTLVINATPVGTLSDESPFDWPSELPDNLLAADLVYNPTRTRFLKEAQERGIRTLGGLGMLVHQARRAIEWWLDSPADCAGAMREAALAQLREA